MSGRDRGKTIEEVRPIGDEIDAHETVGRGLSDGHEAHLVLTDGSRTVCGEFAAQDLLEDVPVGELVTTTAAPVAASA